MTKRNAMATMKKLNFRIPRISVLEHRAVSKYHFGMLEIPTRSKQGSRNRYEKRNLQWRRKTSTGTTDRTLNSSNQNLREQFPVTLGLRGP
jgi:hypothetical protein